MNKSDFYLTILEKGADAGVYVDTDISLEIQILFSDSKNMPNQEYDNLKENVDKFFSPLEIDGFFKIENNCPEINPASNRDWISQISVELKLTPKGLSFINEHRKLEATYKANRLTRYYILATIGIGILTFSVGVKNLKNTEDDINKRTLPLKIHISQMEQHIKKLQQDSVQATALYQHTVLYDPLNILKKH